MEQLVLLLVIGAISFINWLIQRSAEHKKKRRGMQDAPHSGMEREPPPLPGMEAAPEGRFEPDAAPPEEMRRFFEALGIPIEEAPPPPPPKPRVVLPFEESPAPTPVQPVPQKSEGPARSTVVSTEMRDLARRFASSGVAVSPSETPVTNRADFSTSIKQSLSSPDALRQAIVLREILGPPRALSNELPAG